MQNFRCVGAVAAVAAFVSGAAFAQTATHSARATLVAPDATPREAVIEGVAWRCDGDRCAGAAERKGNLDGVVRECRKVVAVIGPVSSYRSGGRELSDGQIRACNRGAVRMQTARN
ncbi:MAG: CC_3452 family protein [Pseudomonadota bacterium]